LLSGEMRISEGSSNSYKSSGVISLFAVAGMLAPVIPDEFGHL
jgi:hypothetical protein